MRSLMFAWLDIVRGGKLAEVYECDLCLGRGRFSVCWGSDGEGMYSAENCSVCQATGQLGGDVAMRRLVSCFGDDYWIRALRMADGQDCGLGIGKMILIDHVAEAEQRGVITIRPEAPKTPYSHVEPRLGWAPTAAGDRVLALLREHGR